MAQPNRKIGRPFSQGETVEHRVVVTCTPSEFRILEDMRGDVQRSTFIKKLIDREWNRRGEGLTESDQYPPAPVLGRACCGDGCEVIPLPPGLQIIPPYSLPSGSYALIADGDSMEGANPRTAILDGSIVFFRPTSFPTPDAIHHIEWNDGARQYATLKKLIEKSDGTFELEPLNKNHKKLVPLDDSWTVRGVHVRTLPPSPQDTMIAQARRLRAQVEGEMREKKQRGKDEK